MDVISNLPLIISIPLSGGCGGLVVYLVALKNGRVENNHYWKKGILEVVGGMVTATFLWGIAHLFLKPEFIAGVAPHVIAFLIGVSWAGIIESIRVKLS